MTSAHLYRLFKTSSSPRTTASKQTMQNIVMVNVEFSLDNTDLKFADLSGNQLPINFKTWFKNRFGEIHMTQGLNWVLPSLSHHSLLLQHEGLKECMT